jgi:serine/threonine protein kinase
MDSQGGGNLRLDDGVWLAGITLGIWFSHGRGLLHGPLKASNVLFDADPRIQIADFSPIHLEGWAPAADVSAFPSRLFEIALRFRPPVQRSGRLSMAMFQDRFGE